MEEFPQIEGYTIEDSLGQGGFGQTYRVIKSDTKEKFALKIVLMEGTERDHKVKREVEVLHILNNPCIIRIRDSFEKAKKLYIIMDYASGGTLRHILEERAKMNNKFTQEEILEIMEQLVFAIKYCHNKQIVHRDLKPDNIFLDQDLNVKLGDFGLSSILLDNKYTCTSTATMHYASPEIFDGAETRFEPDIFALGVILYELVTFKKPFDGPDPLAIMQKITSLNYDKELLQSSCHYKVAEFVKGMIVFMHNRPTILQVSGDNLDESPEPPKKYGKEESKDFENEEDETGSIPQVNKELPKKLEELKIEDNPEPDEELELLPESPDSFPLYIFDEENPSKLTLYDLKTKEIINVQLPVSFGAGLASILLKSGEELFICGGRGSCRKCAMVNLQTKNVEIKLKNLGNSRRYHSLCVVTQNGKTCIYCIGGATKKGSENSCERYSLDLDTWVEIEGLSEGKNSVSCVHLDDYIYCIGGLLGKSICSSRIERLDITILRPFAKHWEQIPYISKTFTPRMSPYLLALPNSRILILGGAYYTPGRKPLMQYKQRTFILNAQKEIMPRLPVKMGFGGAQRWNRSPPVVKGEVYFLGGDAKIVQYTRKGAQSFYNLIDMHQWGTINL